MTEEINKSDINKMNKIIFKKINEQFDKDLTPSEFIATSRLAIAFQKVVEVDETKMLDSKEIYEKIMKLLNDKQIYVLENEEIKNE
ncbi:hypothetical protein N9X19_01235 [Gammaproteobacteria bacterium]|nr:hypothetical protein [Gammaproteobacteria bacterium]